MITLGQFSTEFILPLIGKGKPPIRLMNHDVRVNSNRLECLKRNQTCVTCHRTGTIFLLQRHIQGASRETIKCFIENCPWCYLHLLPHEKPPVGEYLSPHLNLYHVGRRGHLLLMTQDHILPRSAGGSNQVYNLQTMCRECNQAKGATIPKIIPRAS